MDSLEVPDEVAFIGEADARNDFLTLNYLEAGRLPALPLGK